MNKKSLSIVILSVMWMGISIYQWAITFPDFSNLAFGLFFGLVGLYFAYDQWFKSQIDDRLQDTKYDIQAIDKKLNLLEGKVIDLKSKGL